MRKFILLLAAIALVGASSAQVRTGQMTVAYGWVRQADGTRKDITGLKLDYTATPVVAGLIGRDGRVRPDNRVKNPFTALMEQFSGPPKSRLVPGLDLGGGSGGGVHMFADTLIYNAGATGGTGFGILDPNEFVDPSSLDDIVISASGTGKAWTKMNFGLHVEGSQTHQILFRIRIFNSQINSPQGQMDFGGEFADFGAFMTPIDPNDSPTNIYQIAGAGMAQAGVVVPDTDCFMAMQFRAPQANGEGAFQEDMYNVYQVQLAPNPGTSQDTWIYDGDPLDGIYEDTEIDSFEAPNHGNLAFAMWVNTSGQSATGLPFTVSTVVGTNLGGNFVSLWFDDTNTYDVRESFSIPRNSPGIDMRADGTIPTQSPTSIRLQVTTQVNTQPTLQKVEMWRFGGTPGWVLMDSRNTTAGGVNTIDALYGGSIPLSQFVDAGGTVRARVTCTRGLSFSTVPAVAKINKINWFVTY